MRFSLQLAARYCSISAITLSTLLSGSVNSVSAAQFGYGDDATQIGAYGPPAVAAPASAQNFATSYPLQSFQSDSTGSNYQSMSPDNWGNSGPSGTDPFYAGANTGEPSRLGSGSFAYGQPAAQNPPVQNTIPSYASQQRPISPPGYRYESTGAPAVQDLVGGQQTFPPATSNRNTQQSPFRPAQHDAKDPKDIPLAPTIPSSVLDADNNRLDLPSRVEAPIAEEQVTLPSAELDPVELEPKLQPPVAPLLQSPVDENASPKAPLTLESMQGNLEMPANPQPPSVPQAFAPSPVPPVSSPEIQYPRTTAPPFASGNQYPQTTASPIAPMTQAPLAPYQMPQVFETAPVDATALAPTTAVPQNEVGSGFGWGDAPGMFQRGTQPSPAFQAQPVLQPQQGAKPSFPLPFGLNAGSGAGLASKLFGKRGKRSGLNQSQPDFSQPNFSQSTQAKDRRSLFGGKKEVDPNTYPPQPISNSQSGVGQSVAFPNQPPNAQFRPDLGQRAPYPTVRNPGTYDSGHTEYDFENKKREFPPFSEILATGRWFGSIEAQFLKPRFNGNSGITILDQSSGSNFTDSQVFDFDFEFLPSLRAGFESKYGPGFEFDYRILTSTSDVQSFTSAAGTSASLRAALPDVSLSSVIATTAPGQTLSGTQRLGFESFGLSVFKEVQLPVTRINGMFGFQAIDIDHAVDAAVADGAGAVLQNLGSRSDMRAFGPRLRIEYFRPVGHTKLEFLSQFGGSLLFGKRDQFVFGEDSFQRIDVDEIVTTFRFLTALQIKQRIGENRSVFGRVGYLNETFNSGGSGFLAQDDFGLRGFTILVGINR